MAIIASDVSLNAAVDLARTAAQIAHEAQPYPADGEMFKGLAALSNALGAASLRCLGDALLPSTVETPETEQPAGPEEDPVIENPEE